MTNENEEKTSGVVKTVTDLAKTIPIYQDTVQPAAKEVGKSLQIVAKTVNIALAPIKALVWSYDKLEQFINKEVTERLQNTPEEEIQTPKPNIAVPAIQGLMLTDEEPELQELFANLLSSAMDKKTSSFVHPAFVEAIKQMTPDEARLMRYFSQAPNLPLITIRNDNKNGTGGFDYLRYFSLLGEFSKCENPSLTPVAIDNLIRLGFINIPLGASYIDKTIYEELNKHPRVQEVLAEINNKQDRKGSIVEHSINLTDIGRQFINICITDHRESRK